MTETLGSLLRKRREALGLTVEDVEKQTHIRAKHLRALEADDLSAFPSVPQARGFIRNYTNFLGLSEDGIRAATGATRPRPQAPVSDSAQQTQPRTMPSPPVALSAAETQPAKPVAPANAPDATENSAAMTQPRKFTPPSALPKVVKPNPIRRIFNAEFFAFSLGTLLILGLIGFVGYYVVMQLPAAKGTPTLASIGEETPSAEPSLTATTGGAVTESNLAIEGTPGISTLPGTSAPTVFATSTPFPTPLGGIYTTVHIRIEIALNSFLVVTIDGKEKLRDRVTPGEVFEYDGNQNITIATGNGAGIHVFFNGTDQGLLGGFGEAVTKSWGLNGPVVAVSTATPTVAVTPTK